MQNLFPPFITKRHRDPYSLLMSYGLVVRVPGIVITLKVITIVQIHINERTHPRMDAALKTVIADAEPLYVNALTWS